MIIDGIPYQLAALSPHLALSPSPDHLPGVGTIAWQSGVGVAAAHGFAAEDQQPHRPGGAKCGYLIHDHTIPYVEAS